MLAYKMIRVAMLVVVAYVLAKMFQGSGKASKGTRVPGFLIAFVMMAALMSLLIIAFPEQGEEVRSMVVSSSASLLTVAMAGVGLSMDLRQTVRVGRKLMPVASLVWIVQLVLLLSLTKMLV